MDPTVRPTTSAVKGIPKDAISALRILREALSIPSKNRQLALCVILLVLLPYTVLFLFNHFLFHPYLHAEPQPMHSNKLLRGAATTKTMDGNILMLVDFLSTVAYWSLGFFEVLITTFATSATNSGEHLSPLELLKRTRREWRGPVLTQLYVALLRRGYWSLVDTFTDGLSPIGDGWAAFLLAALCGLLSLSGYLLYYYMDVAWESSLPASVVDGCSGFPALGLAAALTRGRRLQGIFVTFFCGIVCEAINLVYDLLFRLIMSEAIRLVLAVCFRSTLELLYMSKVAAFTVFYYECTAEGHGEEESQYSTLC